MKRCRDRKHIQRLQKITPLLQFLQLAIRVCQCNCFNLSSSSPSNGHPFPTISVHQLRGTETGKIRSEKSIWWASLAWKLTAKYSNANLNRFFLFYLCSCRTRMELCTLDFHLSYQQILPLSADKWLRLSICEILIWPGHLTVHYTPMTLTPELGSVNSVSDT